MPGWLALYVHDEDIPLLHQRLNDDPEIAFILQDGPDHWRAVERMDELQGRTMLWHIPGGPLPLLGRGAGEPDKLIEDPFAGWQERNPGMDYSVPYFGPTWPSALLLEVFTPGWRGLSKGMLPISGVSYFADHPLAKGLPSTRAWWRRLRAWVRRHAKRITREGPLEAPHADVWALPGALRAIHAGFPRDDQPFILRPPLRPGTLIIPEGAGSQVGLTPPAPK